MTFQVLEALAALERTPSVVQAVLSGLSADWGAARPTPHDWNAHQVACHLLSTEESVWMVRARLIADGRGQPFPMSAAGDPSARYPGIAADEVVERFRELRSRSVLELQRMDITTPMLAQVGVHPVLGPVSLRQLLAAWVVHDLNHVRQLHEALAAYYASEVGPWRRLLGVLDRVAEAPGPSAVIQETLAGE